MASIKHQLNTIVSGALDQVTGQTNSNANVITSSRPEFGDYQANGVMAIAKLNKSNPRELAQLVVDAIKSSSSELIEDVEVAGPGFINIKLNYQSLLEEGNKILLEPALSIPTVPDPMTIVVDYSSPNLAKEMHVGHLRGTIIGDCLARVLERQGHRIIRQNHVGDWGTQFGMLITYMQELAAEQEELSRELSDLENFYRAAKARFDDDAAFADRAREAVVKLQGGDPEYLLMWEDFIAESLQHCEAVYDRLGIKLTRADLKAESFYNDKLEGIVQDLAKASLLTESDGAQCVFLDQFKGKEGEPLPVIIQKTGGGYLYATTDLAAVQYRSKILQADRSLYVVDARQSLHFQQVFAVAEAAGFSSSKISLEHIAYGTMMGSDGKPFKTRSGDTIKLAELLDEAVRRAHALVVEKNPELGADTQKIVAEKVGIGAVKYADLSKNRTSDYIFDWSAMLSFEGNTAPYLLYAYARIRSILRKHAEQSADDASEIVSISEIEDAAERTLLLKNLQLAEITQAVAEECFPNQLCTYLYELAGVFMRFYENCPILQAAPVTRDSRLALAALTSNTLHQGLELLGIETLEQM